MGSSDNPVFAKISKLSRLKEQVHDHSSGQLCTIAHSYVKRSLALHRKDLMIKAAELYIEAIQRDSRCLPAYLGLAEMKYRYNKLEDSLMLLNQAASLDPENPKILSFIATIRHKIDKKAINSKIQAVAEENLSLMSQKKDKLPQKLLHKLTDSLLGKPVQQAVGQESSLNDMLQEIQSRKNQVNPPQ